MPRPLSFDPEAKLDQAIQLFWERGYGGACLDDLVQVMGIHRASLYNTFGGKDSLYLACLTRFRDQQQAATDAMLAGLTGLPAIRRMFEEAGNQCLCDCRGCLIVNAGLERGLHDPAIAAFFRESLHLTELRFQRAIEQGQRDGSTPARISPVRLARSLTNSLLGLRILAHSRPSGEMVRDVIEAALENFCDPVLD